MKKRPVFFLLNLLNLLLACWLGGVLASVFASKAANPNRAGWLLKILPPNPETCFRLGERASGTAYRYFSMAVRINPFYSPAWYGLAKTCKASGQRNKALRAISIYRFLDPSSPGPLLCAARFYMSEGAAGDAFLCYRRYMGIEHEKEPLVFDELLAAGVSPQEIARNVVAPDMGRQSRFLAHLIRRKRLADALSLWNSEPHALFDDDTRMYFCGLLIRNGKYEDALSLWRESRSRQYDGRMVTDGGFEWMPEDVCLDWHLKKTGGARVALDSENKIEGEKSLFIGFDGKSDPEILISQIVPLRGPGIYVLKAWMKTDALSSASGVFVQAAGFLCNGPDERTAALTGTNPWKPCQIELAMPAECGALQVFIRRRPAGPGENITGKAWIDGVELSKK